MSNISDSNDKPANEAPGALLAGHPVVAHDLQRPHQRGVIQFAVAIGSADVEQLLASEIGRAHV